MDLPYRIFGAVAHACERMSRSRVNGIGFNWWLMLGIGMFTGAACYQTYESIRNRAGARDVTVAQAVADKELLDTYVRVTGGQLAVEHALSQGKPGEKSADGEAKTVWVPILDEEQRYAMYVQLHDGVARDDLAGRAIRGMLRRLKNELKDHVAAQGIKVEGVRIDTGVMLVAGERPARLWLWASLASVGVLIMLLMLLAAVLRYEVFRREKTTPLARDLPPVDPADIDLRVTGKFRLHERARERFINVPSIVAEMESGDRGLLANVDASRSIYGHVTEPRGGMWGILIKSGTLEPPQYGTLYAGFTPRPAMRLRFTDAVTGRRGRAVLSFATPAGRDAVRAALYAPRYTRRRRRHPLIRVRLQLRA